VRARVRARQRDAIVVDPVGGARSGERRGPAGTRPARAEARVARRHAQHAVADAQVAEVAVGHGAHTTVDGREGTHEAQATAMERGLHLPPAVRDLADVLELEADAALGRAA